MRVGNVLKQHCVYKISFPDGSYYFGATCNLKQRINQHKTAPISPYKPNITHTIQSKFPKSYSVIVLGVFTDRIRALRAEKNLLLRHFNDERNINRKLEIKLNI